MAASTKITPMRWHLLAALAAICALVTSTGGRAEDPGQDKKEKKMTKTESGLEYRDVKEGTGAKPDSGQTCSVHYTGWLWVDGQEGQEVRQLRRSRRALRISRREAAGSSRAGTRGSYR